jgi:hypothetical protein
MSKHSFSSYVRGPTAVDFRLGRGETVRQVLVLWLRWMDRSRLDAVQTFEDLERLARELPRGGPVIHGLPSLWRDFEAVQNEK